MRPSQITPLLLLIAGAASAEDLPKVLLWTSPQASEIRNIAWLVEQGSLKGEGLRVRGIYHASETTDYRESKPLARAYPWLEFEEIDCPLTDAEVFSKNGCSTQFRQLFEGADGAVFSGGPDLQPWLYHQETTLLTKIRDPARHRFEIAFLVHLVRGVPEAGLSPLLAERPTYPILAICLGMQSLNVALGGTLIQDIPSQVYGLGTLERIAKAPAETAHSNVYAKLQPEVELATGVLHPIALRRNWLADAFVQGRSEVQVLSKHHQAVSRLGAGLRVWATSRDGKVIEAIAHDRFLVLGVQFHPEERALLDIDAPYRTRAEDPTPNPVAARMATLPDARAFSERLWSVFSERLAESARNRPGRKALPKRGGDGKE